MNTTNMPGLTAEAAISKTNAHYRTTATSRSLQGSRTVLPQLMSTGFCMADCDYMYGNDWLGGTICKFNCIDQAGDIGGGGTGGGNGGREFAVRCRKCKAACYRGLPSREADCLDNCSNLC
jgi:hypothetical protein